ncbi:alpha-ketoglutarate-dependent dioxygenase AlkB [Aldersonia sp. NBC_00410]|uniref:alpha-ketoglutarate-dependent dioxygenase AlkB n=1 Tax=Aldersonia sp. NBC_00410 TaxID=2975954 RepID=UPI00224E96C6|nr:alpha-ketoglutarate-dependent dioxygenase AlkB [Aldersonia sp. NBC_00410]MCX5045689.1 alpha-ketoglutarate-dependent dioxygenase AlkB [Aldersonia sp. NBC_00410]
MFESDQISLFDTATGGARIGELGAAVRRTNLSAGAWVDHCAGWVSGSDDVFTRLLHTVDWQRERRPMYDRVVDVPRLLRFYGADDPLPDPLLVDLRAALDAHYRSELGERFGTVGMCCYRDGADSVAWHGDTIGRGSTEDTMVAIVSLGQSRPLLLRPRAGGASRRYSLGHGDLLVMGGSCQRTWEHCVPKTTRPTGPRISIQFRPQGVR